MKVYNMILTTAVATLALLGCGSGDKGSDVIAVVPPPPVSDIVEQGVISNSCARLAGKYSCSLTQEEVSRGERRYIFSITERTTKKGTRIYKLESSEFIADGNIHERVTKEEKEDKYQKNRRSSRRDNRGKDDETDYYYSKVRYSVSCLGSEVRIHAVGSEGQRALVTLNKIDSKTLHLLTDGYVNEVSSLEERTCAKM